MSVRSHYSETSFMNTRATSGARLRKQCKTCIYRMQVEGEIIENPAQKSFELLTPLQQKRLERIQKQVPKANIPEKIVSPSEKATGIFKKIGNYIAKNQADLKAAGETSLMEDLSDAGKKMFNQAGQLGEEETANIRKLSRSSGSQRKDNDDEVIDFLIGNRGGKK